MNFTEIKIESFCGASENPVEGDNVINDTQELHKNENSEINHVMHSVEHFSKQSSDLYPFVCGLCNQTFNNLYFYFTHFKSHRNIGMENLQLCINKENLCIDKNGRLYQCEMCQSNFITICELHFHLICQENVDSYVYHHGSKIAERYHPNSASNKEFKDISNDINERHVQKINDKNKETLNSRIKELQNETQIPEVIAKSPDYYVQEAVSDSDGTDEYFSDYNKQEHIKKKTVKKKTKNERKRDASRNVKKQKIDGLCSVGLKRDIDEDNFKTGEISNFDTCIVGTEKPDGNTGIETDGRKVHLCIKTETAVRDNKSTDDYTKTELEVSKKGNHKISKGVKNVNKGTKEMDKSCKILTNEANSKPKVRRGGVKAQVDEFGNKIYANSLRVPCHICGGMYPRQNLRNHLLIHTETRNFQCDVCLKWYKSNMHLKMHKEHHQVERNFICRFCGKCFNTKGNLRQHERTHTAKRLHECQICQAKFTSKFILKKHSLVHSDVKPYVCEICHQDFKRHYGLIKHRVLHQTERPFPCPVCGKMFKTKRDCDKHEMIHKPPTYFCRFCGKSTITRANMKIHEKIHLRQLVKKDETPTE